MWYILDAMQAAVKLRAWRVESGISQSALAEMIGCDQTMVSHYERGGRPSFDRMCIIRDITAGAVDLGDWSARPDQADGGSQEGPPEAENAA